MPECACRHEYAIDIWCHYNFRTCYKENCLKYETKMAMTAQ